jgi:hypothetical protein
VRASLRPLATFRRLTMPISQAKKDKRVLPLIAEVQQTHKISYHRSKNGSWGCEVVGKTAHISYQKTKNPGGALVHELLHVIVQRNGYRRPKVWFSTIDQTARFNRLMSCLDNELQHHKMYRQFVTLGFASNEFYGDDDIETPRHLDEALGRPVVDLLDILPDYFTLIAPGGALTQQERQEFEQRFMKLGGGQFRAQFKAIGSAVDRWVQSATYDAQPTLRAIFLQLQNPCYTWLGYTDTERPPDGFFVDKIFEVDETAS